MNKNIKGLISDKDIAYKNKINDPVTFRQAKNTLSKGINEVKLRHGGKIEELFSSGDTKHMWANMNLITQYKDTHKSVECTDSTLADSLNVFYARFDKENKTRPTPKSTVGDSPLVVSEHDVRRSFGRLNVNKAAGPDKITTKLLKTCASELTPVFTHIFNWSLETCCVPKCFKRSTIIPVPKKKSPQTLNDYRPVALTSVVMKCFETIVSKFIRTLLPPDFDKFQFAYRANRSVDDAITINTHEILKHLETRKSYARILFIDFSSAFNTIIPQKLYEKLSDNLSFPVHLCNWILDFLLMRPQEVKVGNFTSTRLTLNTGTPQGCVLSPTLYTIFTHDCASHNPGSLVLKFADDTTVTGLISDADEEPFREQIDSLVQWCSDNNLLLNVSKTKELIVDFRKNEPPPPPLTINGSTVERVSDFKFLGTFMSNSLGWETNCTDILKRARQRMYFLRKLKSFGVSTRTMTLFYRAIIESVLTRSIIVWFDRVLISQLNKLDAVIRNAEKIIGINLKPLEVIYKERTVTKTSKILKDSTHPARQYFEFLPHGKRMRTYRGNKRFTNSLFPEAVKIFNL